MKPKLIIIRGNSGSGKSTVAEAARNQASADTALINQDYIRRTLLKDQTKSHQPTAIFLDNVVRQCLAQGFNVILEGVLSTKRYRLVLEGLVRDYPDNHVFYLDVSLDETLRRHSGKPIAHEVGEDKLRGWYIERDLLDAPREVIIPETSSADQTIQKILADTGLQGEVGAAPPQDHSA